MDTFVLCVYAFFHLLCVMLCSEVYCTATRMGKDQSSVEQKMRQHKSKCKKTMEHAERAEDKGKTFGVHEYKYSVGKWLWLSSQPVEAKSLKACDVRVTLPPFHIVSRGGDGCGHGWKNFMYAYALPRRRTAASTSFRAVT